MFEAALFATKRSLPGTAAAGEGADAVSSRRMHALDSHCGRSRAGPPCDRIWAKLAVLMRPQKLTYWAAAIVELGAAEAAEKPFEQLFYKSGDSRIRAYLYRPAGSTGLLPNF